MHCHSWRAILERVVLDEGYLGEDSERFQPLMLIIDCAVD